MAMINGDNIILPKLGDNPASIKKTIGSFVRAGYTVNVVFMDVQRDEAFFRMVLRYIGTNRLMGRTNRQ